MAVPALSWCLGPNGLTPLPDGMRPPYTGRYGSTYLENPCRECGISRVGLKPEKTPCFTCGQQAKVPETGLHSLPNYIFANTQVGAALSTACLLTRSCAMESNLP